MIRPIWKGIFRLVGVIALLWLGIRFLLPLALPFLLGALLAVAAEPLVKLGTLRLKLPRALSAGIGVSVTILILTCLLTLLMGLLIRQLTLLAKLLPDLEQAARQGLTAVQELLLSLAARAPSGVRSLLTKAVLGLFGGNALTDGLVSRLPGAATSMLSHVPDGALTLFTAVISGFMVSARLPALKRWAAESPLLQRLRNWLPVLQRTKQALLGYLKAQLRLSGMSFCVLLVGFLLLRVEHATLLALLTALVDAVPVLGTGTVLLPWALVCLLKESYLMAAGLGALYVVTLLTRSVLEPRLVGRQLGLDPLLTLAALYAGYRLWGIAGMLLSPLLCVAGKELTLPDRDAGDKDRPR